MSAALFLSTVKHLPHKKKHGKRNEKNHEVHEEVDEGQENYEEACDEEKHYCEREAREELGVPRNEGAIFVVFGICILVGAILSFFV